MKSGKLPESMLKRSIFKQIRNKRKEVITGAKVGIDGAVIDVRGAEGVITSSSYACGSSEEDVYMAVVHAINNVKVMGGNPVAVEDVILIPEDYNEPELRKIAETLEKAACDANIQICGGHTQIVSAVNEPVITVNVIGMTDKIMTKSKAHAGMDIVMVGYSGMEGVYLAALKKEDVIKEKYNTYIYDMIMEYKNNLLIKDEAMIAISAGADILHDIGEGGVFGALWDIAQVAGTGIKVDFKKIPIKQETIEVCEIFDINPYALKSAGSFIIICDRGYDMAEYLRSNDIDATVIGTTTDNNDRILINEDEVRYLEPPKRDEYYSFFA